MSEPNWEGFSGTTSKHRTVGPHRAWCYECVEWCYADSPVYGYCPCCEQVALPEEYRGLSIVEVIEKARADERKRIARGVLALPMQYPDGFGPMLNKDDVMEIVSDG